MPCLMPCKVVSRSVGAASALIAGNLVVEQYTLGRFPSAQLFVPSVVSASEVGNGPVDWLRSAAGQLQAELV
jgi:hypothetical protein